MRITIVGCGAIGTKLAVAADEMAEVKRIYLIDSEKERAESLNKQLKKGVVVESVEDELYHCDLVIEATSQDVAKAILPKTVGRGVDIMVMSVGALVDDEFRSMVFEKAKSSDACIYIPSGALAGADSLRAASIEGLESVELVCTNGPKALQNVEYLSSKKIDINKIEKTTQVFSGTAREAVQAFPKNVNVAATVSLLGIGFDKTTVTIICDPKAKTNSYELKIKGKFGDCSAHTFNVPTPDDPKTSYLASLSAIAALKRIIRNEWIGI